MKHYNYPVKKKWNDIASRPVLKNAVLDEGVKEIFRKVKSKGDKAIRKYTKSFDSISLKELKVTELEISYASSMLSDELKTAIKQAKQNIETFHSAQKEEVSKIEIMPGIHCWRRAVPIEKVGLYIPGGTAPLFSTILMLAVPANIAGCKDIMLCTPPAADGTIHPAILYTAHLCGITEIFKAGGAQAIAAMAYGTKSIPKVFKIFGPGNQYVTAAKKLAQQYGVAIDLPAGPSELLVIADESCIPPFVAADLLSQAEHGGDSQVVLVTTSKLVAISVESEIYRQLKTLPRKKIAKAALKNSRTIIVESINDAIELTNIYAPEHLMLCCENASSVSEQIIAAGSIFIGNYSPESAGDYATGTNHTLPTNGYAASYSGVSLDSFVKKITFQQLSEEGLQNIGNTVMQMAAAEGLDAHRNAVAIRLKS